jgi:diadenosine tetraphosphate (Ap4A) HIT family hydrolase
MEQSQPNLSTRTIPMHFAVNPEEPILGSSRTCSFHTPPVNVNYDDNPSVFGAILRGELPTLTLNETASILAFEDKAPRAPLHALVIPKKHIKTVVELRDDDLHLLQDMHQTALILVQKYYPEAAKRQDYILCYHVPPFNSVDHLHLHVLAPASEMNWIYKYGKYLVGTPWCTGESHVRRRLQAGMAAVPSNFWGC